jgi:predicted transcriptional regulator
MHNACMTVLTIRDVSPEENEQLKKQAEQRGQSLQQFLRSEIRTIAQRSVVEEHLRSLLAGLPPAPPGEHVTPEQIVAAVRASRDEQ